MFFISKQNKRVNLQMVFFHSLHSDFYVKSALYMKVYFDMNVLKTCFRHLKEKEGYKKERISLIGEARQLNNSL